jgi:hypothetical protein
MGSRIARELSDIPLVINSGWLFASTPWMFNLLRGSERPKRPGTAPEKMQCVAFRPQIIATDLEPEYQPWRHRLLCISLQR